MSTSLESVIGDLKKLFEETLLATPNKKSPEFQVKARERFDELTKQIVDCSSSAYAHFPFSSLSSAVIKKMGYEEKTLSLNWDVINDNIKTLPLPAESLLDSIRNLHRVTNVSDLDASEALRRILVNLILIDTLHSIHPKTEARSGKLAIRVIVVPEYAGTLDPAVVYEDEGLSYTLGGRPDYAYGRSKSNRKPSDAQLADREKLRSFAVQLGFVEVKSSTSFGTSVHKAEGAGPAIYFSEYLNQDPELEAIRYILTDGYRWKFCVLDRKSNTMYVQHDYMNIDMQESAHVKTKCPPLEGAAPFPHSLKSDCMEKPLMDLRKLLFVLDDWLRHPGVLQSSDYYNLHDE